MARTHGHVWHGLSGLRRHLGARWFPRKPSAPASPDAQFRLRVLAGLYAFAAVGTAAYWTAFFAGPARTSDEPGYLDFERSFLMADAYLAAMSGAAAIACWRQQASALPLGLMSCGGWVFVGLMDTLYNLQHGKYRHANGPMAVETLINVTTLLGGALSARTLWGTRAALRQPSASAIGSARDKTCSS